LWRRKDWGYTAGRATDPALRPKRSRRAELEIGAIAQLGERFNGIEEVVGSIPSGSTITNRLKKLINWLQPSSLGAVTWGL
jgi:hypothetical protein